MSVKGKLNALFATLVTIGVLAFISYFLEYFLVAGVIVVGGVALYSIFMFWVIILGEKNDDNAGW